tara:strand:- start:305 stop:625 length:321 start_codon:yes stop_codon:yes gene_type:complete
MNKMTKATRQQVSQYQQTKPVYRLYGHINCQCAGGTVMKCPVEFVNDDENEIMFEVMAPAGFHFDECSDDNHCCAANLHSLLCTNKVDVEDRTSYMTLVQCEEEEV